MAHRSSSLSGVLRTHRLALNTTKSVLNSSAYIINNHSQIHSPSFTQLYNNNKRLYSTRPFDPSQDSSSSSSSTSTSSSSTTENKLPRLPKKKTILDIARKWKKGEPISVLTAHDYSSGHYIERAGNIDIALVGDSLAMVACGYDSTSRLGLDELLYHCRAVARGAKTPFLVSDMPFGTYQGSMDQSVDNAVRILREGYMDAVKVEGGQEIAPFVERLTKNGIPVMGHVGLTPQTSSALGGFRVQGKTAQAAKKVYDDAQAIAKAGAFTIVLEAIPPNLAKHITDNVSAPTIGIGAGPDCSGQVLVTLDMLGGFDRFVPKFVKTYLNLSQLCSQAIASYSQEVKDKSFPKDPENSYANIPQEEFDAYLKLFEKDSK